MRSDVSESGGTILEYALIGAFGSVMAINALSVVGEQLEAVFATVAAALAEVVPLP